MEEKVQELFDSLVSGGVFNDNADFSEFMGEMGNAESRQELFNSLQQGGVFNGDANFNDFDTELGFNQSPAEVSDVPAEESTPVEQPINNDDGNQPLLQTEVSDEPIELNVNSDERTQELQDRVAPNQIPDNLNASQENTVLESVTEAASQLGDQFLDLFRSEDEINENERLKFNESIDKDDFSGLPDLNKRKQQLEASIAFRERQQERLPIDSRTRQIESSQKQLDHVNNLLSDFNEKLGVSPETIATESQALRASELKKVRDAGKLDGNVLKAVAGEIKADLIPHLSRPQLALHKSLNSEKEIAQRMIALEDELETVEPDSERAAAIRDEFSTLEVSLTDAKLQSSELRGAIQKSAQFRDENKTSDQRISDEKAEERRNSIIDVLFPGDETDEEKLQFYAATLLEKNRDIKEKLGDPSADGDLLFGDDQTLGQAARKALTRFINPFTNTLLDDEAFIEQELDRLAPIVLNNQTQSFDESGLSRLASSFVNSAANVGIDLSETDAAATREIADLFGVETTDEADEVIKTESKATLGEKVVSGIGTSAGLIVPLSVASRIRKGAGTLARRIAVNATDDVAIAATKQGSTRALINAKSPKLVKFFDNNITRKIGNNAIDFEIAGRLFEGNEDELNATSAAAGGILESGLNLALSVPEKLGVTGKALGLFTATLGFAVGETLEELGENINQYSQEHLGENIFQTLGELVRNGDLRKEQLEGFQKQIEDGGGWSEFFITSAASGGALGSAKFANDVTSIVKGTDNNGVAPVSETDTNAEVVDPPQASNQFTDDRINERKEADDLTEAEINALELEDGSQEQRDAFTDAQIEKRQEVIETPAEEIKVLEKPLNEATDAELDAEEQRVVNEESSDDQRTRFTEIQQERASRQEQPVEVNEVVVDTPESQTNENIENAEPTVEETSEETAQEDASTEDTTETSESERVHTVGANSTRVTRRGEQLFEVDEEGNVGSEIPANSRLTSLFESAEQASQEGQKAKETFDTDVKELRFDGRTNKTKARQRKKGFEVLNALDDGQIIDYGVENERVRVERNTTKSGTNSISLITERQNNDGEFVTVDTARINRTKGGRFTQNGEIPSAITNPDVALNLSNPNTVIEQDVDTSTDNPTTTETPSILEGETRDVDTVIQDVSDKADSISNNFQFENDDTVIDFEPQTGDVVPIGDQDYQLGEDGEFRRVKQDGTLSSTKLGAKRKQEVLDRIERGKQQAGVLSQLDDGRTPIQILNDIAKTKEDGVLEVSDLPEGLSNREQIVDDYNSRKRDIQIRNALQDQRAATSGNTSDTQGTVNNDSSPENTSNPETSGNNDDTKKNEKKKKKLKKEIKDLKDKKKNIDKSRSSKIKNKLDKLKKKLKDLTDKAKSNNSKAISKINTNPDVSILGMQSGAQTSGSFNLEAYDNQGEKGFKIDKISGGVVVAIQGVISRSGRNGNFRGGGTFAVFVRTSDDVTNKEKTEIAQFVMNTLRELGESGKISLFNDGKDFKSDNREGKFTAEGDRRVIEDALVINISDVRGVDGDRGNDNDVSTEQRKTSTQIKKYEKLLQESLDKESLVESKIDDDIKNKQEQLTQIPTDLFTANKQREEIRSEKVKKKNLESKLETLKNKIKELRAKADAAFKTITENQGRFKGPVSKDRFKKGIDFHEIKADHPFTEISTKDAIRGFYKSIKGSSKLYDAIFEKLLSALPSDFQYFIADKPYNKHNGGFYSNEGFIVLAPNQPKYTLIHEMVHAVITHDQRESNTKESREIRDEIISKMKAFLNRGVARNRPFPSLGDKRANALYGFDNDLEFAAELISNPRFAAHIYKMERITNTSNTSSPEFIKNTIMDRLKELFITVLDKFKINSPFKLSESETSFLIKNYIDNISDKLTAFDNAKFDKPNIEKQLDESIADYNKTLESIELSTNRIAELEFESNAATNDTRTGIESTENTESIPEQVQSDADNDAVNSESDGDSDSSGESEINTPIDDASDIKDGVGSNKKKKQERVNQNREVWGNTFKTINEVRAKLDLPLVSRKQRVSQDAIIQQAIDSGALERADDIVASINNHERPLSDVEVAALAIRQADYADMLKGYAELEFRDDSAIEQEAEIKRRYDAITNALLLSQSRAGSTLNRSKLLIPVKNLTADQLIEAYRNVNDITPTDEQQSKIKELVEKRDEAIENRQKVREDVGDQVENDTNAKAEAGIREMLRQIARNRTQQTKQELKDKIKDIVKRLAKKLGVLSSGTNLSALSELAELVKTLAQLGAITVKDILTETNAIDALKGKITSSDIARVAMTFDKDVLDAIGVDVVDRVDMVRREAAILDTLNNLESKLNEKTSLDSIADLKTELLSLLQNASSNVYLSPHNTDEQIDRFESIKERIDDIIKTMNEGVNEIFESKIGDSKEVLEAKLELAEQRAQLDFIRSIQGLEAELIQVKNSAVPDATKVKELEDLIAAQNKVLAENELVTIEELEQKIDILKDKVKVTDNLNGPLRQNVQSNREAIRAERKRDKPDIAKIDKLKKEIVQMRDQIKKNNATKPPARIQSNTLKAMKSKVRELVKTTRQTREDIASDKLADIEKSFDEIREDVKNGKTLDRDDIQALIERHWGTPGLSRAKKELSKAEKDVIQARTELDRFIRNMDKNKTLQFIANANTNFRAMLATGDVSAVLRQGSAFVANEPRKAIKTFMETTSIAIGILKGGDLDRANDYMRRIMIQEGGELAMTEHGLQMTEFDGITSAEEAFMTDINKKWQESKWMIPRVMGHIMTASEVHMTLFLNMARATMFKSYIDAEQNASSAQRKYMANFINRATGRGDLLIGAEQVNSNTSDGEKTIPFQSHVLFAPRWTFSRFNVLADFSRALGGSIVSGTKADVAINAIVGGASKRLLGRDTQLINLERSKFNTQSARNRVLKTVAADFAFKGARALAYVSALSMLGFKCNDLGESTRASSNTFGKIRCGNLVVDVGSGFSQVGRVMYSIYADIAEKTDGGRSKDAVNDMLKFGKYKLSPLAHYTNYVAFNEDVFGREPKDVQFLPKNTGLFVEKITNGKINGKIKNEGFKGVGARAVLGAAKSVTPLSFKTLSEGLTDASTAEGSLGKSLGGSLLEMFGEGVNFFEERPSIESDFLTKQGISVSAPLPSGDIPEALENDPEKLTQIRKEATQQLQEFIEKNQKKWGKGTKKSEIKKQITNEKARITRELKQRDDIKEAIKAIKEKKGQKEEADVVQ